MARIVLVLIGVSALMFMLVLQTPPQFVRTALSGYVDFPDEAVAETEEEKKEPAPKKAPKKSGTTTVAASGRVSRTAEVASDTTETIQQKAPVVTSPAQNPVGPWVFCVANDQTALYSLNSPDGSVVGVLRKGEIVEPQLEINDGGRTWAFVNVAGQKMSGFLPSDSLERQRVGQTIQ